MRCALRNNAFIAAHANRLLCGLESISPVARDPNPAAGPAHPVAFDPYRRWPWPLNPGAAHPHIVGAGPAPVTTGVSISRPRRDCFRLDPHLRRSPSHKDLSRDRPRGRSSRRYLSCGCRCCRYWRRFLSAADQRKWRQCQYVNAYSHKRLLFMDSFRSSDSALCELVAIFPPSRNRPRNRIAENGF
jgi:hypothetical protein